MPFQDKKKKIWTGTIQKRGLPRKVKKGFKTKTAAKEWERVILLSLQNPQEISLTFSEASNKYLTWCEKHRKLNTCRQKSFIFRSLITFWGCDPALDTINKNMIEEYLDSRFEKNGGASANRDLREVTTLFRWFYNNKYCDLDNPCLGIEQYKSIPFLRYVPPPEDINAVMLNASQFEYDFIQCVYHTAARRKELQRLKWDDVNFQTGSLILWTRKRKGGGLEKDELKMNSVIYQVLEARYRERNRKSPWVFYNEQGEQVSKNTLDKIMPRLCQKAEVKNFGFTAIRHHVAAVLADSKKLSLIEIQKQLRHKRATTTDIYLKSLVVGENRAADVLENAQKKVFNTKVNTIPLKRKGQST